MKKLKQALRWLLCAVMITGVLSCSGEKVASGKNAPDIRMQQGNPVVSDGKYREKRLLSGGDAPECIVVENNSLGSVVRTGEKALESCVKNATCRSGIEQMGIITGLTNAQIEEAMKAGVTRDPAVISALSPAQIEYLDNQIRSGKGMTDIMLGKETWGDRLVPSHTGGGERADTGPSHTGNSEGYQTTPSHTGNTDHTDTGASHTGNTEGKPDTGGNTIITPVPEGPKKDDLAYLALKGKEAQEAASKLGFDRRIPTQKAPFNSHGQPVFYDGKNYITPDIDSHNATNGWKMFNSKGKRIGTYNNELNRIKD